MTAPARWLAMAAVLALAGCGGSDTGPKELGDGSIACAVLSDETTSRLLGGAPPGPTLLPRAGDVQSETCQRGAADVARQGFTSVTVVVHDYTKDPVGLNVVKTGIGQPPLRPDVGRNVRAEPDGTELVTWSEEVGCELQLYPPSAAPDEAPKALLTAEFEVCGSFVATGLG